MSAEIILLNTAAIKITLSISRENVGLMSNVMAGTVYIGPCASREEAEHWVDRLMRAVKRYEKESGRKDVYVVYKVVSCSEIPTSLRHKTVSPKQNMSAIMEQIGKAVIMDATRRSHETLERLTGCFNRWNL